MTLPLSATADDTVIKPSTADYNTTNGTVSLTLNADTDLSDITFYYAVNGIDNVTASYAGNDATNDIYTVNSTKLLQERLNAHAKFRR